MPAIFPLAETVPVSGVLAVTLIKPAASITAEIFSLLKSMVFSVFPESLPEIDCIMDLNVFSSRGEKPVLRVRLAPSAPFA